MYSVNKKHANTIVLSLAAISLCLFIAISVLMIKMLMPAKIQTQETQAIIESEPEEIIEEIIEQHYKVYMAINEKYLLDDDGYFPADPSIVMVNGRIMTALSTGKTTLDNGNDTYEVEVTDMIYDPEVREERELLPCNIYSVEDNEYLDTILATKIKDRGYQTRAGAVEAARFLLLQFPYRMKYFSENGRLDGGYALCDGEGRYYHEGLYLNVYKAEKENFKAIIYGPEPWGCPMYSIPYEGDQYNSLDCSGFVAWVLKNGGFDPGDVGAGPDDEEYEMTDLGTMHPLTYDSLDEVRIGDLFSEPGHIAILIGKKDGIYYIAESNAYINVRVRVADKDDLMDSEFTDWIDMDEFYNHKDGDLTDYWIPQA